MGLLHNNGGVFSLTRMAREHLVKASPWFIGPLFRLGQSGRCAATSWPFCARTNHPIGPACATKNNGPGRWRTTPSPIPSPPPWIAAALFGSRAGGQAGLLAASPPPGHRRRLRRLCLRHRRAPSASARLRSGKTPVDRLTRRSLAARGFADRVEVLVGDMFAEALPAGFDLHLFSNVLHDWDEGA
jgi:hypothetical protein